MTSFISKVVSNTLKNHTNLASITFVLPSQRACLFLKNELQKHNSKTQFLPEIVSIEHFIEDLSGIKVVENVKLLFELYSVYKQCIPSENIESFESFLQWANIALHDFNEIDSHLVNSKALFATLYDIKRLNTWFKNKPASKMATNHLKLFERLHLLYQKFSEQLKIQQVGYQGFAYKKAVEKLPFFIKNNNQHIIFAGFNALNKAEELIFQELLNNEKASVYWDVHSSYFDTKNEASWFIKKYKNEWKYYQKNPFLWIDNELPNNQNIQITGVAKNVGQAKYIGELLLQQSSFEKTAYVLADENTLPITLQSIPKNVKNINVTMGYPLKNIPLAEFLQSFFELHLNRKTESSKKFHYKNVLEILKHPYFYKIDEKGREIASEIIKENKLFISQKYLKNKGLSFISFFSEIDNISQTLDKIISFLTRLKEETNGIEKEFCYTFIEVFKLLQTLDKNYGYIKDLKTLFIFYEQILRSEKLSFQGEPLAGLQIMGMLETRALDFENVFISSVNEGVLPAGKTENSFVPYDVKRHFKLPTYQEKDAIFSYHFQRLLQRAKNIFLLYNTETDGYGSGEKSRFLTRMLIENDSIKKTTIGSKTQIEKQSEITIQKTPEVLNRLREVFEKEGISPSALSNYVYNPIGFYEQRVLGVKEDILMEETIAANTMGTVIHGVLEDLYKPYIGKHLQVNDVKKMLRQVLPLQKKHFEKSFFNKKDFYGKNKLIFEVTHHYISTYLKKEIELLQQHNSLKIIATEQKLEGFIDVKGIDFPIKIRGTVDRIDLLNDTLRIIDYKTGKVIGSELKTPDFNSIAENQKTKALQVMLYTFLFAESNPVNYENIESGIISFKSLNSGFLKMNFTSSRTADNQITEERIFDFMESVKQLLSEILNPEIPFIENKNNPFAT